MKKVLKKSLLLFVIILAVVTVLPINDFIYAYSITNTMSDTSNYTPSKNLGYNIYDYVVDKYDVDIVVNKDNTFDITERITTYFNLPKHGIYRKIPLRNEVIRVDGTTSENRAKISNLKVSDKYSTSRNGLDYVIKIGSADKFITGKKEYTITYKYDIGKDPIKDYDELYYNIIGDGWDTVIGNITFKITMPETFDKSKLGFSSGRYGSTDNELISYEVNDNVIYGRYNGILGTGQSLTVRLELPEGYFKNARIGFYFIGLLIIIISIIFAVISWKIWQKYGKDIIFDESIEFYPPDDYNSLEIGFLYKGYVENKDITSLLIYLANKGYIKICEEEEKSLFGNIKKTKIIKLKEYDGDNLGENIFMRGLFRNSRKITNAEGYDEIVLSDLSYNFYTSMNKISSIYDTKENREKIFEKYSSIKRVSIAIMIFITVIMICTWPIMESRDPLLLPIIIFPIIGIAMFISSNYQSMGKAGNILCKIFGIIFGFMPWISVLLPIILKDPISIVQNIIGYISIILMIVFYNIMPKRNEDGARLLARIKGFKTFLETAEKERLEALVLEDPSYFYNILPYTYVLGVSNKWISKFEVIGTEPPTWYYGDSDFSISSFGHFVNDTMKTANLCMSSSPSSSSSSGGSSFGGSSSGGGFSGGGSGGGGGGSW